MSDVRMLREYKDNQRKSMAADSEPTFTSMKARNAFSDLRRKQIQGVIKSIMIRPSFAIRVNGHDLGVVTVDFGFERHNGMREYVAICEGVDPHVEALRKLERGLIRALHNVIVEVL